MIKSFLLDLIFPRFCLGCLKELDRKTASFTCDTCLNSIALNGIECHVCGFRTIDGVCKNCKGRTSLKCVWSAGKYENLILREAINHFKYNSIESLKKPLAELVVKYLKKENLIDKLRCPTPSKPGVGHRVCLVPIPLTWRRKLSRGFNQSELLAKELSHTLNCPVINLLKRQKFNAPQAKISDWKKRKENISGAFALSSEFSKLSPSYPQIYRCPTSIKYMKVILVDDVSTSGATLEEAAKVLKIAGFKEIYGLVVAKG